MFIGSLTATGGISALVNIVTRVNIHVTKSVTLPGIASRPKGNLIIKTKLRSCGSLTDLTRS